jgi:phage gp36-like protein
MSFITDSDYPEKIKTANLEAFTDSLERAAAESTAIDLVRQYLFQRYDTTLIFSTTGTARNRALVKMCTDIALYMLFQRLPKRQLPDWVEKQYDEAIAFLERVVDGKITMDLPRKIDQSTSKPKTKFRASFPPKRTE